MTEPSQKRGFATRPRDPDAWVRAPEPNAVRGSGDAFTARLTIDVTPALRGRIKIAAFQRGITVAELTSSWAEAPLFAVQGASAPTAPRASTLPQAGSPSAVGSPGDRSAFGGRSDGLFVALSRRNSAS